MSSKGGRTMSSAGAVGSGGSGGASAAPVSEPDRDWETLLLNLYK